MSRQLIHVTYYYKGNDVIVTTRSRAHALAQHEAAINTYLNSSNLTENMLLSAQESIALQPSHLTLTGTPTHTTCWERMADMGWGTIICNRPSYMLRPYNYPMAYVNCERLVNNIIRYPDIFYTPSTTGLGGVLSCNDYACLIDSTLGTHSGLHFIPHPDMGNISVEYPVLDFGEIALRSIADFNDLLQDVSVFAHVYLNRNRDYYRDIYIFTETYNQATPVTRRSRARQALISLRQIIGRYNPTVMRPFSRIFFSFMIGCGSLYSAGFIPRIRETCLFIKRLTTLLLPRIRKLGVKRALRNVHTTQTMVEQRVESYYAQLNTPWLQQTSLPILVYVCKCKMPCTVEAYMACVRHRRKRLRARKEYTSTAVTSVIGPHKYGMVRTTPISVPYIINVRLIALRGYPPRVRPRGP